MLTMSYETARALAAAGGSSLLVDLSTCVGARGAQAHAVITALAALQHPTLVGRTVQLTRRGQRVLLRIDYWPADGQACWQTARIEADGSVRWRTARTGRSDAGPAVCKPPADPARTTASAA